jgi:protein-S-isoprenylcysteine O-methyltransferase Ste14
MFRRAEGHQGEVWVLLQFMLITWLAARAWLALNTRTVPLDAMVSALAGVALGLWAISANRPGNFNIRPIPREGAALVRHGPYRFIRHPMYSAVLLCGLAAARCAGARLDWLALIGLAAVLFVKARREEQSLIRVHRDYLDYMRRSRRFIPWVV